MLTYAIGHFPLLHSSAGGLSIDVSRTTHATFSVNLCIAKILSGRESNTL